MPEPQNSLFHYPVLCPKCGIRGVIPVVAPVKDPFKHVEKYMSISKKQIDSITVEEDSGEWKSIWICPEHGEHLVTDFALMPDNSSVEKDKRLFDQIDKGYSEKVASASKAAEDAMRKVIEEVPTDDFSRIMNSINKMEEIIVVVTKEGHQFMWPARSVCLFTDANPPLLYLLPRHIKAVYNWSNVISVEIISEDDPRIDIYYMQKQLEKQNE